MQPKIKLTPYDVTDHIQAEEDMAGYLEACKDEDPGDGSLMRAALGDVARARVRWQQPPAATAQPAPPALGATEPGTPWPMPRATMALWDVEAIAKAVEADAGQALPGLRESLGQAKRGELGYVHTPEMIEGYQRKAPAPTPPAPGAPGPDAPTPA